MRFPLSALPAAALLLAVGLSAPLAAQGPAAQARAHLDTASITPNEVGAGRGAYHGQGTCFACHGANLEGGPVAPTLRAHAWRDAKGGDFEALYFVITHGVPGTAMVAHPGGISDADALQIAAYVWAVDHRGVKP